MSAPKQPLEVVPNMKGTLTFKEIAERCMVKEKTVQRWVYEGIKTRTGHIKLKSLKIGRARRISEAELAEFVNRQNPDYVPPDPMPKTGDIKRRAEAARERLREHGMNVPDRT